MAAETAGPHAGNHGVRGVSGYGNEKLPLSSTFRLFWGGCLTRASGTRPDSFVCCNGLGVRDSDCRHPQ